ncbi:MAG: hypothetical protein R2754_02390 [Microthrixaceae bacterium]
MSTERTAEANASSPELEQALANLLTAAQAVRDAATDLKSGSDAEADFAAETLQAVSGMELDLTVARATLAARRSDSAEGLDSSLNEASEAARRWLDDAAVQARLGSMEARDRMEAVGSYLDRARAEVVRAAERVGDAVGTELEDMRTASVHAIGGIRTAVVDAAHSIRHLSD